MTIEWRPCLCLKPGARYVKSNLACPCACVQASHGSAWVANRMLVVNTHKHRWQSNSHMSVSKSACLQVCRLGQAGLVQEVGASLRGPESRAPQKCMQCLHEKMCAESESGAVIDKQQSWPRRDLARIVRWHREEGSFLPLHPL